ARLKLLPRDAGAPGGKGRSSRLRPLPQGQMQGQGLAASAAPTGFAGADAPAVAVAVAVDLDLDLRGPAGSADPVQSTERAGRGVASLRQVALHKQRKVARAGQDRK